MGYPTPPGVHIGMRIRLWLPKWLYGYYGDTTYDNDYYM